MELRRSRTDLIDERKQRRGSGRKQYFRSKTSIITRSYDLSGILTNGLNPQPLTKAVLSGNLVIDNLYLRPIKANPEQSGGPSRLAGALRSSTRKQLSEAEAKRCTPEWGRQATENRTLDENPGRLPGFFLWFIDKVPGTSHENRESRKIFTIFFQIWTKVPGTSRKIYHFFTF